MIKKTFWVDSYYWGTDLESLVDRLASEQLSTLWLCYPATEAEIYSAIRNRIEGILPNHSEKICGKIITVR